MRNLLEREELYPEVSVFLGVCAYLHDGPIRRFPNELQTLYREVQALKAEIARLQQSRGDRQ